jgi:hypothetical protein
MFGVLDRFNETLDRSLTPRSRLLTMLAFLVIIPTFFLPLWQMTFYAQQYPEGLEYRYGGTEAVRLQ